MTKVAFDEIKTLEIKKLLEKATDAKMAHGNADYPIATLSKALEICDSKLEEEGITPPYPALVNYRLALLKLREPNLSELSLQQIYRHLLIAKNEISLGPWPNLYSIAVMHRLKKNGLKISSAIKETIEIILKAIEQEGIILSGNPAEAELDYPALLQSHLFNALELSVFFTDSSYKPIEGLHGSLLKRNHSEYFGIDPTAQRWVLFTSDKSVGNHIFPRSVIEREAKSRFASAKDAGKNVLLIFTDLSGRISACLTTKSSETTKWTKQTDYQFLRQLLSPSRNNDASLDCDKSAESIRKGKERTFDRLRSMFGDHAITSANELSLGKSDLLMLTVNAS